MTEHKVTFLTSAINDAQELIRFIDNKTAVANAIIGVYISTFIANTPQIVAYSKYYGNSFWFWLFIFCISICVNIAITIRILFPTNNPNDNLNRGEIESPSLKFFLPSNSCSDSKKEKLLYHFVNKSEHKLEEDLSIYFNTIMNITEDEMIKSLTFELFKVNFIRNIKNDRFKALIYTLLFTSTVFIILYLSFVIQTHDISTSLKYLNK